MSFQTTIDDPIIKRVETAGKVRPHVKDKIVDEGGNVEPIGTPGELLVSGYLVQKGLVIRSFSKLSTDLIQLFDLDIGRTRNTPELSSREIQMTMRRYGCIQATRLSWTNKVTCGVRGSGFHRKLL